jgi:hypothetical protein
VKHLACALLGCFTCYFTVWLNWVFIGAVSWLDLGILVVIVLIILADDVMSLLMMLFLANIVD